ncbi:MAG: hypothetical protein AMXMBFR23_24150 [Chloroflexota bacterium]
MRALGAAARDDRVVLVAALIAFVLLSVALHPVEAREAPRDMLVVADLRGGALVLIDPTEPQSARRIPLPGGPHELLRLPDGRVAVSLEQTGQVAIVDLATGEVRAHAVGGYPHGLALDRAGALLVTDRAAEAVRRFTFDPWVEQPSIPAAGWPHAVVVSEAGEVIVALASASAIQAGPVRLDAPALSETVAIAPDGRIATAGAMDGVVAVFAPDGALLDRYEVGGRPVRVAFDATGTTLAVALSAAGAVALIEGDTVRTVRVAGVPDGIAFSSDGARVYVSDVAGGYVTAVDVRAGAVAAVIAVGQGTGAILATAD